MFFLYTKISEAGISQFSMDSLGTFLVIFLLAESSAEEALARVLNVEVGEDETDLEDFDGELVLELLVLLCN